MSEHRRLRLPRPRRLEGHAPMQLAVRPPGRLLGAAEVEIRVSRIPDRPAAIVPLKGGDGLDLLLFLLLGHGGPVRERRIGAGRTGCWRKSSPAYMGTVFVHCNIR